MITSFQVISNSAFIRYSNIQCCIMQGTYSIIKYSTNEKPLLVRDL